MWKFLIRKKTNDKTQNLSTTTGESVVIVTIAITEKGLALLLTLLLGSIGSGLLIKHYPTPPSPSTSVQEVKPNNSN
jgi:hypothetical protein